MFKIDDPKANVKNILHGFFLAVAVGVAEPSTILPLMVKHFSDSAITVGIFASLLKGGAVAVQMWAAFHAQEYARALPYLRAVFFFRWFSWFLIGFSIYFIGDSNKTLTLWLIGIGFFGFSFTAGFGAIYFKEILAKVFSQKYRGTTMANRQIFTAIGSILSGGVAGYVLQNYPAPLNYAYLFMVSSFLMAIGFVVFGSIKEPIKTETRKKEKSFLEFLKNSLVLLREDKRLSNQIFVILLGFSYMFSYPFVILKANDTFELTGWMLGGFITVQMIGSIVGSFFIWRKMSDYKLMLRISFVFAIISFVVAFFANNFYMYGLVFLFFGLAMDGFSISGMNLVFEIAPEDKRPIYTALQSNITSLGLFFPILGGFVLKYCGYDVLYVITICMTVFGLYLTKRL